MDKTLSRMYQALGLETRLLDSRGSTRRAAARPKRRTGHAPHVGTRPRARISNVVGRTSFSTGSQAFTDQRFAFTLSRRGVTPSVETPSRFVDKNIWMPAFFRSRERGQKDGSSAVRGVSPRRRRLLKSAWLLQLPVANSARAASGAVGSRSSISTEHRLRARQQKTRSRAPCAHTTRVSSGAAFYAALALPLRRSPPRCESAVHLRAVHLGHAPAPTCARASPSSGTPRRPA